MRKSSLGDVCGFGCVCRSGRLRRPSGFTLIELMVVVLVVAIIAAVAYPSYISSVTKTKRAAAEACLSEYANYMERYYTTNLRYDQDGGGNANSLPALDCASAQNTGEAYEYSFPAAPTATTYTIQAVPQGAQASRDAQCGTLTLDQAGTKGISGTGTVATCW